MWTAKPKAAWCWRRIWTTSSHIAVTQCSFGRDHSAHCAKRITRSEQRRKHGVNAKLWCINNMGGVGVEVKRDQRTCARGTARVLAANQFQTVTPSRPFACLCGACKRPLAHPLSPARLTCSGRCRTALRRRRQRRRAWEAFYQKHPEVREAFGLARYHAMQRIGWELYRRQCESRRPR